VPKDRLPLPDVGPDAVPAAAALAPVERALVGNFAWNTCGSIFIGKHLSNVRTGCPLALWTIVTFYSSERPRQV